ncbi:hypothetical protein QUB70_33030 [Microcoleus sp. A003_D6]|uniref:hypothetical protein n=1 Tax=Microcoleus sp. A003_D6 TaxID=3055266 RepID=UPI002FD375FF
MKLLTEIGSDDFGKLEIRSPKIKTAPQAVAAFKSHSILRAGKPATQQFKSKKLRKLAARQLSFSPPASRLTSSPHDFLDFGIAKSRRQTQNFTSREMGDRLLMTDD